MSFRSVTGDDQGNFYAISNDGDLFYYRDEARNGSARWAFDGVGQKIGNGWGDIHRVFSGGDGILYAITWDGHLLFFRDEARDGSERWALGGTGQDLGRAKTPDGADAGWLSFWTVFSGGDGVIYAITFDGDLLYFKDLARDGRNVWAAGGAGQRIGTGWGDFLQVFPGGDGVIYAVNARGAILYYRDEARDGTIRWAFDGVGQEIGQGWGGFWTAFPGGNGIVYALTPTGTMFYYRDESRDGRFGWSFEGRGQIVGHGWNAAQLEGYCWPLSAFPGETIDFHIAAPAGCQVDYLRLDAQPDGALGSAAGSPVNVPPVEQVTDPDWTSNGCGWSTTFTLTVPAEWDSDVYSARCTDPAGTQFHIVFVVKPVAQRRGDLLVLASTNTWNAYNMWGGYSKYGPATPDVLTFLRPNPAATPMDDGHINHLTRADLWIIHWFQQQGFRPNVISDADLHSGFDDLPHYAVLVLLTHPEYWTLEMLDQLEVFLAEGGSLLYLGGNGVFEQCSYSDGMDSLAFFYGHLDKQRSYAFLRNLTPPRPEREILGVGFRFNNFWQGDPSTFAAYPYRILAEGAGHPMILGTGLVKDALIGIDGLQGVNGGGASGWEMDCSSRSDGPVDGIVSATVADDRGRSPDNLVVLARGTNGEQPCVAAHAAEMTYYDTGHGGFVFSVGSICFGGSLVQDTYLQQIVRKALDTALGHL
jgi:Tachylectin